MWLLTLGWVDLPRRVSVYGDRSGERLREPVPAVLVEVDGGFVLLDTGYNTAVVRDRALARRFHGDPAVRPVLPGAGEPLEEALGAAGVSLDDISAVAVSHLHYDHAGGLRHFAGRVPIHCQQAELAYGRSPHPEPERHGIYRLDFDDPSIDWRLADGGTEVAPGVEAVPTPGHTPGHQSFVVRLDASVGGGGLAFDAADLQANLDDELAIGEFIGCRPEDTVEQIVRLKAIAAAERLRLVPGHDPDVWPARRAELAGGSSPRGCS